MKACLRIGGAALGGLLVALLFPRYSYGPLAWVAMMPLLAALSNLQGKRLGLKGFGIGLVAGAVTCLIQFNWLATVSWLAALVLPLYLALYWGLFGAFAASWGRVREGRLLRMAFAQAAVFAGLEIARGWMFTGFAWNDLGVAFHNNRLMAQAADLLGVGGLSLMLVFVQVVWVNLLRAVLKRERWPRVGLGVTAAVVALTGGYGAMRISMEQHADAVPLKALLMQINIPQENARQLWSELDVHRAYEDDTLAALEKLKDAKGELGNDWPDWVVWPETALTGKFLQGEKGEWASAQINLDTLDQIANAGPFTLICGANELEPEMTAEGLQPKDDGRIWNSIAVVTASRELSTYRKRHLVIFGETIPFIDSLPWLQKIYEQQSGSKYGGSFSAGESLEPLKIPAGGQMVSAIPTICFEDSVARLTRKFVRPVPQVIVNVTNDGWFQTSQAAAQHFANARFRAIELRRPMLRAANTGVSAAIDTTGATAHPLTGALQEIRDAKGTTFTRGSLLTEIRVPKQPSFSLFVVIGDWGLIGLGVLGLALGAAGRKGVNP